MTARETLRAKYRITPPHRGMVLDDFEADAVAAARVRIKQLALKGLSTEQIERRIACMLDADLMPSRKSIQRMASRARASADPFADGRAARMRPVVRDDGIRWPSMARAAEAVGVCDSSIQRAIEHGQRCVGHRYRYADRDD